MLDPKTVLPLLVSLFSSASFGFSAEVPEEEPVPAPEKPAKCWEISGPNEIRLLWKEEGVLPYEDNIEMSGKRVSGIISYSIDEEGKVSIEREIFFPQLHEFKSDEDSWFHDYRAYLQDTYGDELLPKLYVDEVEFVPGALEDVVINGVLNIHHAPSKSGLQLSRAFFPSMDERRFVEQWTLRNTTEETVKIQSGNSALRLEDFGARGKFSRLVTSNVPETLSLEAGESTVFSFDISARMEGEEWPASSSKDELGKRKKFLGQMSGSLQLETPDPVLNTLFEFSKIRASESIFESDLGLIHSPGGGRYYVGIWANDQAEYINPFFAYLGYDVGNKSAMNCFRAFAKEMNPEYEPLRYSFEIEGLVKPFPKDRGDAAMIAYGAAHYALALGDKEIAQELWPLIDWCLEYCHRMLTEEGVVASESDEMEGRIETGTANLSTSSLYYGALEHAADLSKELGHDPAEADLFQQRMKKLSAAIESYFGAEVEGLNTYKYYKEHRYLRHWICLPLVVGLHDRKEDTIKGLFEGLWSDNGVHVEKNSANEKVTRIFWDRGTLYALRGTLAAGATEQSLEKLSQFSNKRLLGDRVPYVVEAYPEGDMAHLSAESALYCRVYIEGLFGLQPTGLRSFAVTPRLPEGWNSMSLKGIQAFGEDFDLVVSRKGDGTLNVTVGKGDKVLQSVQLEEGGTGDFSF
ncbi:six-hairpin glycosidase-like protein [Roseibacillus persicicus]|uniref:Six-hairpin glycosidase-like protein n=1 Tax=Roseibacillus persicicus TaxID=454148 RepID=A0A918TSX1_9BACT|nr:six-hairpin glycosidase-like protein [Roseibacillus persicicus]GHC62091.1 hypothetical protein GCM10007100_31820 [Roseibacillus persicicus]